MTAADSGGGRPLADHPTPQAELGIGAMTVRGRGLSPAAGQGLAMAIAAALARQLPGRNARIDGMTVRLPASVLDASGRVDGAALARAVARARRDRDA
jgi:hypothetical protein